MRMICPDTLEYSTRSQKTPYSLGANKRRMGRNLSDSLCFRLRPKASPPTLSHETFRKFGLKLEKIDVYLNIR